MKPTPAIFPGARAWWPAMLLAVTGLAMASPPADLVKGGIDDPKGAGAVSSGVALPPIPPVSGNRNSPVASWGKPLPWPILIADRRNNRLLEVTPDKRIVWEFASPNLTVYSGNEDVNFSADGKRLAVSEEDNFDVHIVDYDKRELAWTYGVPERKGAKPGYLNYPDDAHLLADGKFLTADIRNCRVVIIDPTTNAIATQWGRQGECRHDPPARLAYPNGATPLDNGDILVSEIRDAWITRITREGKVVWSVKAPNIRYPSDAFPTADGRNVIVADFWKPGRVVIFDPATRRVLWQYDAKSGDGMLDHPSLARELPGTGDIIVADDLRHRVVVIDRATKRIIWQYGVTDTPGHEPGYLFYPDGFDLDVFRDWKAAPAASR
ncbi:MAG TPA: PQQ-binding-like beta-propeller repeat protein [Usitatibacteraceae bacterium]|nr:PQQ-binding-like beta-propeller repeat protein [Usitatibacteraceae bacterium]